MSDTITIRLSSKLQKLLDTVTKSKKTSRNEIIIEAITRYLAIRRFRQLRKQVLPFTEAVLSEHINKSICRDKNDTGISVMAYDI